jgi:hypothetical protein
MTSMRRANSLAACAALDFLAIRFPNYRKME